MRRSLRYILSHCVVFMMERKYVFFFRSFDILSSIAVLGGICLMMFTRWDSTGSVPILSLGITTLFIFPISLALQYYFDQRQLSRVLYHSWVGALLGTILVTDSWVDDKQDVRETVANYILISSLILKLVWHFVDRVSGLAVYTPRSIQLDAVFEMLGCSIACFLTDSFNVSLSVLAVAFLMTTFLIRAKSFFGIVFIIPFTIICTLCFFPAIGVVPNYYAFVTLGCRLLMEPVLDIYFEPLTAIERWKWFILIGPVQRIVSVLTYPVLDLSFLALSAMVFRNADTMSTLRLLAIIILFVISLICWVGAHVVFVMSIWLFTGKLRECSTAYKHYIEEDSNMNRILSAKGLHCFTLITRNILRATLLSTVVLGLVSWQMDNALFISVFLLTIPVEFSVCVILGDLGGAVSGTCVGYAVIAPSNYFRTDGNVAVLPPDTFDQVYQRASDTLKNIQQFFRHHYIDMIGCDFLSGGGVLTGTLEDRLKDLFKRSTSDGPRFDTYLVFYSGHVYQNGNWALADGTEFSLGTMLEWWQESNVNSRSRLILILDTEHASAWMKQVAAIDTHFVGLQTWLPPPDRAAAAPSAEDAESLIPASSIVAGGEFTKTWVRYNCSDGALTADSVFKDSAFRPCYAASVNWTDFDVQRLDRTDVRSYIRNNFPRLTWSILELLEPSQHPRSACAFSICRYCRRMKARWLPPKLLETGHGFQLVKL